MFIFFLALLFSLLKLEAANVGLLVVATGKYINFVDPLLESARTHFCKAHKVTYFVFTDQPYTAQEDTVCLFQPRLGWPYDTLMRYKVYWNHQEAFAEQDYLFACDADMLFTGEVGDEILGERVATLHPGFSHGTRGAYEKNPRSTAYVKMDEGHAYFAGGFYGGRRDNFLHILQTSIARIEKDLQWKYIARWHDESHWNRYCIDFPPTVILSPAYCYPEQWQLPYPKKLIALDKNHAEYRR
jgi:histo-blood group ABO system transferase